MTEDIKLPIKLTPNKGKSIFLLMAFLAFLYYLIQDGYKESSYDYLSIAITGLGALAFLLFLFPNIIFLLLDKDGFTCGSLFFKRRTNWKDITDIKAKKSFGNTIIAWSYTPDYTPAKRIRLLNRKLGLSEGAIPCIFGIKPEDLAYLMRKIKTRHDDSLNN